MAEKIAIVGSGLIGRAWAITFARAGHPVALYDADPDAVSRALATIDTQLADLESSGMLAGQKPKDLKARMSAAARVEDAVDGAIHVQESASEDVAVKRALFTKLDSVAGRQTILASSSSALLPSAFTESLTGRGRCLVAHPINPPHLVPAVELVPSPWTEPNTMVRTRKLMAAAGQSPMVMKKEIDGFIMNRLQAALLQEAFRLVEGGYAGVEDVDIGIRKGIGLRWAFMGPFETIDLNAPWGVVDYVARYGEAMNRIAQTQKEPPVWAGALAERVNGERAQRLPRAKLGDRQRWRDRRLMALLRHLDEDDKTIGS